MRRSIWIAVVVTALVLAGAAEMPRLPWTRAAGLAGQMLARVVEWAASLRLPVVLSGAWERLSGLAGQTLQRVVESLASLRLALPAAWSTGPAPWAPAAAGVASLLLAGGAGFLLSRRQRDRRGLVLRLARRGRATVRIARRTRMAQDAVRTLLHPDFGAPRRRAL